MNRTLHRPEPILRHAAQPIDRKLAPRQAAARLRDGDLLVVRDHYSTGAEILAQLRLVLEPLPPNASYQVRQASQRTYREAALRLLAPIEGHQLALAEARPIGFLKLLYPKLRRFFLPFIQVQEMHGAWLRYEAGTHLAVLGHPVHPFFGTYVPSRVSHLELFGTWLSQYTGPRSRAIDVGTGCGVMAFMLCRAGFERVLATDNNPNAIESVARDIERLPSAPPLDLLVGDLLGKGSQPVDLIAFNPPWIQGSVDDLLDQALYFDDAGLFERFFDQAHDRLAPSGRVVMVFSTVLQLLQPDVPHPIEQELERGRFRLVQKLRRKVRPAPSETGQRRRTKERVEVWELALAEAPESD